MEIAFHSLLLNKTRSKFERKIEDSFSLVKIYQYLLQIYFIIVRKIYYIRNMQVLNVRNIYDNMPHWLGYAWYAE